MNIQAHASIAYHYSDHPEPGPQLSESDAVRSFICAIIERAADDVRDLRRQGMIDADGRLHQSDGSRVRLPGEQAEYGDGARAVARDALGFFTDGRLERTCALLNSPIIQPDRLKAHVFGPTFDLTKRSFGYAQRRG